MVVPPLAPHQEGGKGVVEQWVRTPKRVQGDGDGFVAERAGQPGESALAAARYMWRAGRQRAVGGLLQDGVGQEAVIGGQPGAGDWAILCVICSKVTSRHRRDGRLRWRWGRRSGLI